MGVSIDRPIWTYVFLWRSITMSSEKETVQKPCTFAASSSVRVCLHLTRKGREKQMMCSNIHILINTLGEKTKQWVKTRHQYLSNLNNIFYCSIKLWMLMSKRDIGRYCFTRLSEELLTYSCSRAQINLLVHSSYRRFPFKTV